MADAFPRTVKPRTTTKFTPYRGYVSVTQQGQVQRRATTARGRRWTETWGPMKAGDADVEALLGFVIYHVNQEIAVDVEHLMTPGSGKPPNGTGTSGVTVSGGSQTGNTLVTTGWPASTNQVVRTGDVIKVAGIDVVFMVTADANSDGSGNATLDINPSILAGNSPANGASVTTTGVTFRAMIDKYKIPEANALQHEYYGNASVTFRELP